MRYETVDEWYPDPTYPAPTNKRWRAAQARLQSKFPTWTIRRGREPGRADRYAIYRDEEIVQSFPHSLKQVVAEVRRITE